MTCVKIVSLWWSWISWNMFAFKWRTQGERIWIISDDWLTLISESWQFSEALKASVDGRHGTMPLIACTATGRRIDSSPRPASTLSFSPEVWLILVPQLASELKSPEPNLLRYDSAYGNWDEHDFSINSQQRRKRTEMIIQFSISCRCRLMSSTSEQHRVVCVMKFREFWVVFHNHTLVSIHLGSILQSNLGKSWNPINC